MVENTSGKNPGVGLGPWANAETTRVVEEMEADGQRQLVESTVLPSNLKGSEQKQYEELGFIFGDVVADDPIFREATLPEGWKKVAANHTMWSYILDERGFKRVSIFYKAAFYERIADMSLIHPSYTATEAQDKTFEELWKIKIGKYKYDEWTTERGKVGDNLVILFSKRKINERGIWEYDENLPQIEFDFANNKWIRNASGTKFGDVVTEHVWVTVTPDGNVAEEIPWREEDIPWVTLADQ